MHSRIRRFAVVPLLALAATALPAAAQDPPAIAAAPDLAERLERLAVEIERNRVELHVPGAALAVVRAGDVIFARGFGLADVENETPVTPETRFFIGSTTKAFTATLIGMLVDDGIMAWDAPVERYVPYFRLAVDSEDGDARATIRDVLSHRTGFLRMGMLWANGALSSEQILRQASRAEPFAPFREGFYYNNVHYLAAGRAAAAAAGRSWEALIRARILDPLGMTDTETSIRDARGGSRLARGYTWRQGTGEFQLVGPNDGRAAVDAIAPAGSISSTVLDMAKWLRFLLAQGEVEGRPLIREETLAETWTPQIGIGNGVAYGMGWLLRDWRGQRQILHAGSVPGFSAMVGLLPDSELGFVLLANVTAPTLGAAAAGLVPDALLGAAPAADSSAGDVDLTRYLGRYIANFATFSNEVFTVLEREGRLALDIPSQRVYTLNPPDADGRWQFALTDQIAVSFQSDADGNVVSLTLHQAGMTFEVPREGVEVEPEIDLEAAQKYVGAYRAEAEGIEIAVLIRNQRLAIKLPGGGVLDLHPPDDEGRRATRANPGIAIAFDESDAGGVTGLRFWRPGGQPVLRLSAVDRNAAPLPTVDELIALRQRARPGADSARTIRTTGTVSFPQSAVEGRFEIVMAGDDRLRIDMDLGRFGWIRVAINGERGWRDASFEPFRELRGEVLEQRRLAHPAVIFGDWRRYFDSVTVLREDELDGRAVYVVRLQKDDLPATTLSVDAGTGDVLQHQATLVLPGGLGALPTTTTYGDFREIHGLRFPFRFVESNEATGRTVFEVESVEVDVDIDEETFVLHPGNG